MSIDPESAQINWDVTGLDAADFRIDEDGYLWFMSPPDYENPTDREIPDSDADTDTDPDEAGKDNIYRITVRATEMRASGETGRALSTDTEVTVEVTNVNEDGVVDLSWLQPEVGTPITASLSDPDGMVTDLTWEWSVSTVTSPDKENENHWQDATGTIGNGL